MKRIVFALLLIGICGCVSMHDTLRNDQGQTVYCDHTGFGIIGSMVTVGSHNSCIDKYKALGYKLEGEPPAAPVKVETPQTQSGNEGVSGK